MQTITGNLLDIRAGTILHQVNCEGVTGGLAGALRHKWVAAFGPYYTHCRREREEAMGSFILVEVEPGLFIGHVFGQMSPGPCTDMTAVRQALIAARSRAVAPIYAPFKMGCGLGGGDWAIYSNALSLMFPEIIIVQRPEDARG